MKKVTLFLIAILLQGQHAFGADLIVLCCAAGCTAPTQAQCNSLCRDECGGSEINPVPICNGYFQLRSDKITYDKYDASYNSTTNECEYKKNGIACISGYYIKTEKPVGSLIGFDVCFECPAATGVTSQNKNTGNVSSCYIAEGTVVSDGTGTYEYTSNCYYNLR